MSPIIPILEYNKRENKMTNELTNYLDLEDQIAEVYDKIAPIDEKTQERLEIKWDIYRESKELLKELFAKRDEALFILSTTYGEF